MTCAEFEILLCDYMDGALDAERRLELEHHRDTCAVCAELAKDVTGALTFIERAEEVAVPPELLTRIAFEIPTGKQKQVKPDGLLRSMAKFFQPVLQPRFAMGMAMTILSFSLLGRFAGIEVRQLKPSDLAPSAVYASVEDRFSNTWQKIVKYYQGLKVVYDVQTRLREFTDQEDEGRGQSGAPGGKGEAQPGAQQPASNSTEGKGKK
jgi:hypothetical protein